MRGQRLVIIIIIIILKFLSTLNSYVTLKHMLKNMSEVLEKTRSGR